MSHPAAPHHTQGHHLTPVLEASRLVEQWVDGHTGAAVALLPLGMPTHPEEPKLLCLSNIGFHLVSTPCCSPAIFFQFLFGG